MIKQDEQLKKIKVCLNLLRKTLVEDIEPLSKDNIVEIIDEIIDISNK